MISQDARLFQLPVDVPPRLERALGYPGEANFVAFFYDGGNMAYWIDGKQCFPGDTASYEIFIGHPHVGQYLKPYVLGNGRNEPLHFLLLDRNERLLYVGRVALVEQILHDQWPKPCKLKTFSKEHWQELTQEMIQRVFRTPQEMLAEWQMLDQQAGELVGWMDTHYPSSK